MFRIAFMAQSAKIMSLYSSGFCFRFALVNVGASWSSNSQPQIQDFGVSWFVLLKAHKRSRQAFNSLTSKKAISQGQWPSVERMVKSEFEGCEFEDQLAPTFTRAKRKQNKSPESTGSLVEQSLLVNKQDQRSMKNTIKYYRYWRLGLSKVPIWAHF